MKLETIVDAIWALHSDAEKDALLSLCKIRETKKRNGVSNTVPTMDEQDLPSIKSQWLGKLEMALDKFRTAINEVPDNGLTELEKALEEAMERKNLSEVLNISDKINKAKSGKIVDTFKTRVDFLLTIRNRTKKSA